MGAGTSRTGMSVSTAAGASASRPATVASTMSATDTRATQSRRCTANTTSMATGVRITTASAIHRSTPRWARNQYAPATTRQAPIAPRPTMARLASSAKPIRTAAAASISA